MKNHQNTIKKIIISLLCVIIFLFVAKKQTLANIGLSIDPSLVTIQVKPGKAITKAFSIENTSDQDKDLVVRLIPFDKADQNGNPEINIQNTASWQSYFGLSNTNIQFDKPFTLKSKTKEQIVVSISIPQNANIEDLYSTLLISTYDNSLQSSTNGTTVGASIGANILITVTSQLDPKTILKINKITITSKGQIQIGQKIFADTLSPIIFRSSVQNTGNHLTQTKGTITVSKGNETLSVQGLLPQYILSKTTRNLLDNNGEQDFTYKPHNLSFGLHKITIHIKTENTNSSNSIDVYFIPIKLGLAIILSIIMLRFSLKINKKDIDTNN